MKLKGLLLAWALMSLHGPALAQDVVKLGILTDLSGPYADLTGRGSGGSPDAGSQDHPDPGRHQPDPAAGHRPRVAQGGRLSIILPIPVPTS